MIFHFQSRAKVVKIVAIGSITFAKHLNECSKGSSKILFIPMIVRYRGVRWVSANIDDLACVHQLRGEEREWKMCLDDPPPLNVGHMLDGVLEHVSDLGVGGGHSCAFSQEGVSFQPVTAGQVRRRSWLVLC